MSARNTGRALGLLVVVLAMVAIGGCNSGGPTPGDAHTRPSSDAGTGLQGGLAGDDATADPAPAAVGLGMPTVCVPAPLPDAPVCG